MAAEVRSAIDIHLSGVNVDDLALLDAATRQAAYGPDQAAQGGCMSLVTELLERLAGVALLKAKLNDTADRVERLGEWMLELDRRVTRVESTQPLPARPNKKR